MHNKGQSNEMPPVIPMQDFFRNPEKLAFKLSPDGEYISFLKPWQNRLNVHVQKIGETEETRITNSTERDILGYLWANNNRLVYVQDTGGDENYQLYAMDKDGSHQKELTPFENVKVQLVDDLEDRDDELLISLNKRDPRIFDVYNLNISTGELKLVAENPGNVSGWFTDHDGKLRVAVTTDGVNSSILYRETEDDPFELHLTTSFKEDFHPLLFTFDNKNLYVGSNLDRDKTAIIEYNIQTRKTTRMIFEHPDVDVSGLMSSKKRKVITGVSYQTDKPQHFIFDEERKRLQTKLEQYLPDCIVRVVSMNKQEDKILAIATSDKSHGTYYFYDIKTDEFSKIQDISPWLNPSDLADMKPIQYTSRDGLTIHGYLTLPKGVEPTNLPTVVNPHGGPWHRDTWGYNHEVQFLANRGYAVLQVNFRGSIGYGRQFWEKGFKQWGRKMQDDISDGVKWLINQGIADPDKIGIYGASYGGYATLAGLTFTPDLYKCGVDAVGVSNIFSWMKDIPPYWQLGLDMIYEMVGHPEKDKELLESVSPLFHIRNITAPLFIAQGVNDPRVPKLESDQMVDALKKRGIDVEYMVKENEGHGFLNEENRFDFYRKMEQFLAKHLGGRTE